MIKSNKKGGDIMPQNIKGILYEEARLFGTSIKKILGRSRKKSIVAARRSAIRQCRKFTVMSLSEIGEAFGGRDHTTILHYIKEG